MFGLKIGGKKVRTAMQIKRDLNNALADNLRNPSKKNREKVEAFSAEFKAMQDKRTKKKKKK